MDQLTILSPKIPKVYRRIMTNGFQKRIQMEGSIKLRVIPMTVGVPVC